MDKPPSTDGTLFVCHATQDEWDEFTVSEDTALRTTYLEYFEATGEIHIIEFPPYAVHEGFVWSLGLVMARDALVSNWLIPRGASSNYCGRKNAPDLHFGPARDTPGAVAPRLGMPWTDFTTLKIEIGVSQRWGNNPGQLDHNARVIWPTFAGVEYVLCIRTDHDFSFAEFKLYDLPGGGRQPLVQPVATPIVPGTTVAFDARRLLGIPPDVPLPTDDDGRIFPDPLVVDLHAAFVWAMR